MKMETEEKCLTLDQQNINSKETDLSKNGNEKVIMEMETEEKCLTLDQQNINSKETDLSKNGNEKVVMEMETEEKCLTLDQQNINLKETDLSKNGNEKVVLEMETEDKCLALELQNINSNGTNMSKNQRKKLEKHRKWMEMRPQKRAQEKLKSKLKKQQAKESGRDLGPNRKDLKRRKMSDSSCKLRVCFDLSLADMMNQFELSKTIKQLHRCYSINRRATSPLQLTVSGYSEASQQAMSKVNGLFNWDIHFSPSPPHKQFGKEELVYLTSDSPNELTELDDTKVYVIGGLVDHNRLKGACLGRAEGEGVAHAKLPLDTHCTFHTRKVLTIDQVYCILLRRSEGSSWVDAVLDTVPKRKGVTAKTTEHSSDDATNATAENSSDEMTDTTEHSSDFTAETREHSSDVTAKMAEHSSDLTAETREHSSDVTAKTTEHLSDGTAKTAEHLSDGTAETTEHSSNS